MIAPVREKNPEGVWDMNQSQQPNTILIVDDTEVNRAILQEVFCRDFLIEEAESGQEAVEKLEKGRGQIAAVLLDAVMPGMGGADVLRYMSQNGFDRIPVFLMAADAPSGLLAGEFQDRIADVIHRPVVEPAIVRKRVKNTIELYRLREEAHYLADRKARRYRDEVEERSRTGEMTIDLLCSALEFRSGNAVQHAARVRAIVQLLLTELSRRDSKYALGQRKIRMIARAAALHDVGKAAVPDRILLKKEPLTEEERAVLQSHTREGCRLFSGPEFQKHEFFRLCAEVCLHHHERWDGSGYPDGLKGEQISLAAQATAIADAYDCLTAEQPRAQAAEMLRNGECGPMNPDVVGCFLELEDTIARRFYAGGSLFEDDDFTDEEEEKPSSHDISDRTLRLLERDRQRYALLSKISGEILFTYEAESDTTEFTEKYHEVFGGPTRIRHVGETFLREGKISESDLQRVSEAYLSLTQESPTRRLDIQMVPADGSPVWLELYLQAIWDSDNGNLLTGCYGKLTSIHQLKQETLRWKEQATHDYLTGLCNRQGFEAAVQAALRDRTENGFALVFMDIDHFKQVNDTQGHLTGDSLLRETGKLLRSMLRSTDLVARIGGDEFTALLNNLSRRDILCRKAEELRTAFREKLEPKYHCNISCSIGIAVCPEDGTVYSELLRKADMALYDVKERGGNGYAFYTNALEKAPYSTSLSDTDA